MAQKKIPIIKEGLSKERKDERRKESFRERKGERKWLSIKINKVKDAK